MREERVKCNSVYLWTFLQKPKKYNISLEIFLNIRLSTGQYKTQLVFDLLQDGSPLFAQCLLVRI